MTLPASLTMPNGTRYATESAPTQPRLFTLRGDEELLERHYQSRTSPLNDDWKYHCTPSVQRYYKEPVEQQGDFRVDISPMLSAYLRLNGDTDREDPNSRYLFNPGTALFNQTGFPKQAYITMQGNKLKGAKEDDWFIFETLKPTSNVAGMTYESHPWFVHRFDLVCWNKREDGTWFTRHHPNTPQGIIYYYLVSAEGVGWIPSRYVKQ